MTAQQTTIGRRQSILQSLDFESYELYKPLAAYIGSSNVEMFLNVDLDTLADKTPLQHRILMMIFVENVLRPKVEEAWQRKINERKQAKAESYCIVVQDGVLNASGRLLSRDKDSSVAPNKISIKQLEDYEFVEGLLKDTFAIQKIDLSRNGLSSADLSIVLKFVIHLKDIGKLSLNSVVDLSFNSIHGMDKYWDDTPRVLKDLTGISQVKFINIQSNPFCSVDRIDFWRSLQMDDPLTEKINMDKPTPSRFQSLGEAVAG
ncbi:hypothetical protein MP228_011158 [Amoeboaphelidium protococcarum]|nr:hypothetical protein MP228_011158 [Amoeboaphelidium protococcarum]